MSKFKVVFGGETPDNEETTAESERFAALRVLQEKYKDIITEIKAPDARAAKKAKESLEGIRAKDSGQVAEFAGFIEDYFTLPFIKDTFDQHEKRRKWRTEELSIDERSLYELNGYRVNHIGTTLTSLEIIDLFIEDPTVKSNLEHFKERATFFSNRLRREYYGIKTYEERDAFISEIKTFLLDYLKHLRQELDRAARAVAAGDKSEQAEAV